MFTNDAIYEQNSELKLCYSSSKLPMAKIEQKTNNRGRKTKLYKDSEINIENYFSVLK